MIFWGCIGYNLLGPLIEIKGNLNAEKYISNVLEMFYRKCMNRRKKELSFYARQRALSQGKVG